MAQGIKLGGQVGGGGSSDLNISFLNGNAYPNQYITTISVNKKVFGVTSVFYTNNSGDAYKGILKIIVNGQTIVCNETNGTYQQVYQIGASTQRFHLAWINDKDYKDEVITSVIATSGWTGSGNNTIVMVKEDD